MPEIVIDTPGDGTWTPPGSGTLTVTGWAGGGNGDSVGVPSPSGKNGGGGSASAKKTIPFSGPINYHVGAAREDTWFGSPSTFLVKAGKDDGSPGLASGCIADSALDGGAGGAPGLGVSGAGGGSSAGTLLAGNPGSNVGGDSRGGVAPAGGGDGGDGGLYDDLLTNLLAAYRNNGTDHSGHGNDLPSNLNPSGHVNPPGTGPDLFTGAPNGSMQFHFDSVNGNQIWRNDAQIIDLSQSWTISFWHRLTAAPSAIELTPVWETIDLAAGFRIVFYALYFGGTFYIRVQLNTSGGVADKFFALGTLSTWDPTVRHLYAASFDPSSGTINLYVDGKRVFSSGGIAGILPIPGTATNYTDPSVADVSSDVLIQNLFVWQRVLTDGGVSVGSLVDPASDLGRLWNSGNGFDPTAEGRVQDGHPGVQPGGGGGGAAGSLDGAGGVGAPGRLIIDYTLSAGATGLVGIKTSVNKPFIKAVSV